MAKVRNGSQTSTAKTAVVVPCFNEQGRLRPEAFEAFVAARTDVDFVLVDDGSDDRTGQVLTDLADRQPGRIHALCLPVNRGKGEAVRQGLQYALALAGKRQVGYWDADLATPLDAIPVFVETLDRRPDIDMVLGARVQLLGRNIERNEVRHYLGRVFATIASWVLGLPVYDTQCGAKLFRSTDRLKESLATPFCSRWIFDVELLARHLVAGQSSAGIYELPLDDWRDVGQSKVKPTDFVRAVGEMVRIFRRYRLPVRYRKAFDLLTAPFLRYSGAGAVGTALHFGLLSACVELLGLSPSIGTLVGACGGALLNYWLNYHVTFVSAHAHRRTLPRFLSVALLGAGLNVAIIEGFTVRGGGHYLVGQLIATAVVLVVGFLLNRLWTFGPTDGVD